MEHFDSVKTMIDNLRSEDPDLRLNSMRGIHLIASTLGPERTRDELLLYLTDYLDDSDEVLRVFANAMGTMLQEVGGVGYTVSLLGPLEILCGLDEVTIRDEAVSSMQLIGQTIYRTKGSAGSATAKAQADFLAMVQRLSKGTPQCRSSSAFLLATVYANATASVKSTLMSTFQALCTDEEIMVRRAACVAMGKDFAKVLGNKGTGELVPALNQFAKDTSDGIRLQAVSTAVAMLPLLPEAQHSSVLLSIKALSTDSSWRVRYMTADTIGTLAGALSSADVVKYVVPIFRSLCQDTEPEIRAAAVFNMASVLAACRDAAGKKDLLVTGTRLLSDESSHVRMSLASAVLKSVAHVPKNLWGTTIVPTCTTLLGDAEADVRLALVSGFSSMGNTPEAKELAPKLIPVVVSLANDAKWRLRDVVVSQVPYIITSLGRNADEVVDVCVERITDRVSTIRDSAVQSCCKLVTENGGVWAVRTLLPRVQNLAKSTNYLHRVALCHLYIALANVAAFDAGACATAVWPAVVQLAEDPVPNVRLNIAKAALALLRGEKVAAKDAETVLAKLRQDATEDVRDAANQPPPKK